MSGPLFGIVPTGQQLITEPASLPSTTSFLYALPAAKAFSHVMVFLLPNVTLPDNTAAAIYLATAKDVTIAAQTGAAPNFKFLGGIGVGKESALFKISSNTNPSSGGTENDGLMLGVSIESSETVAQQLQQLSANKATSDSFGSSNASQPSTSVLAQRIIQNAFNFLASFSGTAGPGGIEVVPLRAFEEWWRKFESRVRTDPSFLERKVD